MSTFTGSTSPFEDGPEKFYQEIKKQQFLITQHLNNTDNSVTNLYKILLSDTAATVPDEYNQFAVYNAQTIVLSNKATGKPRVALDGDFEYNSTTEQYQLRQGSKGSGNIDARFGQVIATQIQSPYKLLGTTSAVTSDDREISIAILADTNGTLIPTLLVSGDLYTQNNVTIDDDEVNTGTRIVAAGRLISGDISTASALGGMGTVYIRGISDTSKFFAKVDFTRETLYSASASDQASSSTGDLHVIYQFESGAVPSGDSVPTLTFQTRKTGENSDLTILTMIVNNSQAVYSIYGFAIGCSLVGVDVGSGDNQYSLPTLNISNGLLLDYEYTEPSN